MKKKILQIMFICPSSWHHVPGVHHNDGRIREPVPGQLPRPFLPYSAHEPHSG